MSTRFVILENPARANTGRFERYVAARDGWSVVALAAPALWLLWHRAWFAGTVVLVLTILIPAAAWQLQSVAVLYVGTVALAVLTAFEGGNWVVNAWRARGFSEVDVVLADNREDAEVIFAARLQMHKKPDLPPPLPMVAKVPPRRPREAPDMIFGSAAELR